MRTCCSVSSHLSKSQLRFWKFRNLKFLTKFLTKFLKKSKKFKRSPNRLSMTMRIFCSDPNRSRLFCQTCKKRPLKTTLTLSILKCSRTPHKIPSLCLLIRWNRFTLHNSLSTLKSKTSLIDKSQRSKDRSHFKLRRQRPSRTTLFFHSKSANQCLKLLLTTIKRWLKTHNKLWKWSSLFLKMKIKRWKRSKLKPSVRMRSKKCFKNLSKRLSLSLSFTRTTSSRWSWQINSSFFTNSRILLTLPWIWSW